MQIIVKAPVKTKDVLVALRDWQPENGLRFTLDRRKSGIMIFDVTTASGLQAVDQAMKRLKEEKLDDLPDLEISVL